MVTLSHLNSIKDHKPIDCEFSLELCFVRTIPTVCYQLPAFLPQRVEAVKVL